MRLATITNWAYGATVALTLVSGTTMLFASGAQERERAAVAQRFELDRASSRLDQEIEALTDVARQYLNTGDATYLLLYRHDAAAERSIEERVRHVRDAGARPEELDALREAIRWADSLRDEQQDAVAAHERGDEARARQILFGAEYERELDRARGLLERFQDRLDQRTEHEIAAATGVSRLWRGASEVLLAITGLLFLCVLYFVFKRRVLHPVVRLSDVVSRLAAQDYAVEPPDCGRIDEIGDMAQAIRVFRENGLERQRLEGERNSDLAMREMLSRMTQRMQGCDTLPDLSEVVQRFVPQIAHGLAGKLYLLDNRRNAVVEACGWLEPRHSATEFSTLACWALRRGLPHRPAGVNLDVPCDHLCIDEGALPDTLCLPLMAHREVLGLLYFEARGERRAEAAEGMYLDMLAENVSLALANLRLRDALREMAMADSLTGLPNRRQLDATLELQLAAAERAGDPIACLMVDVDHFKRFNDAFGHDAGDAVLREVGGVLRGATREDGQAFRYGGEEFLLLLPGFDTARAEARGEDIRRRIADLRVVHGGSELGPVSASIGVAGTPEHGSPDRLVLTADAALYRAKALGRNRVVVAETRRGVARA